MIIVYDYQIIQKDAYYYVKPKFRPVCENCGAPFMVRGSKKRYLIMETGEKKCFQLRQLYCRNCRQTHLECPNIIMPYKHYSKSAIISALSDKNTDCSAENSTIHRWKSEWK